MTPDRIAGWLRHRPAGSTRLELSFDGLTGLTPVAEWEREELDGGNVNEAQLASQIVDQSQEWTDGEGEDCKFLLRWMSQSKTGRAIKVTTHRCKPTPTEEVNAPTAGDQAAWVAAMVAQNQQQAKQLLDMAKQVAASTNTMQQAYERTIQMLGAQNETLHRILQERSLQPPTSQELSDEQRAESLQRAEALKTLTDRLPDVLELGLAAAARKLLPDVPGQESH